MFDKYAIGVFVIVLIIIFFIRQTREKKNIDKMFSRTHEALHAYSHLLRDFSYRIINDAKDGSDNTMRHCLEEFSNKVVETIKNALCALSGIDPGSDELAVSIQRLHFSCWDNTRFINEEAMKNTEYTVLSRSLNAGNERQRYDEGWYPISQCRELFRLFIDGWPDWIGLGLKNKRFTEISTCGEGRKKIQYENPCHNWSRYYNNIIVVPVRVKRHIIDPSLKESEKRNLFAFICVEFKNNRAVSKNNIKGYCDFLKSFADSMYIIYDDIYKNMSYSKMKEGANCYDQNKGGSA